jgi:broad specificity polyphosphatase/5'/3'-nucleotidase SurE
MIQTHRLRALLLVALSFAISSFAGCSSDSDDQPAGRLRILVTNDDGVTEPGIDAVARALAADSKNEVVVCAPNENRSGVGDMTGPSDRCGDGETTEETTTESGYPAVAIDGCPADAVNYAVDNLYAANAPPHVVISGLNDTPSQGLAAGGTPDFDAGAKAVLDWLAEHRNALLAGTVPTDEVDNLNIPTCEAGSSIRGFVEVPMAEDMAGFFNTQNCESTLQDPKDDVEGLNNGFITLSPVPAD